MKTCRLILTIVSALIILPAIAQSQHHRASSSVMPLEQIDFMVERQQIEQLERNINVMKTTLGELEIETRRIIRNLDALHQVSEVAGLTTNQSFAASQMYTELHTLEITIMGIRRTVAADIQMLAQRREQLLVREEEYDRKINPNYERDRTQRQNERLIQEFQERQQQEVALQNLQLMNDWDRYYVPHSSLPPSMHPPEYNAAPFDQAEIDLCRMLEKKVSETDYDIAEINLLATRGLPGAENLDVDKTLKTLDRWAKWVKHETDRHFYRFRNAPEEYCHSEGYFRILMMVCILQQDFKVCYNKDPKMRAGPVEVASNDLGFFANSQDLFVHGLTENMHQGTCASLPVFYVAIGRRLGYPLKLVLCKQHIFARWEDASERFNIEGTSRGLNCFPDQEYMEWPWPISKEELATGMYMNALSPRGELAAFLELRALCLKQHRRENEFLTVKLFADDLLKKEGVDVDKLRQLMRESHNNKGDAAISGGISGAELSETNSWRGLGNERDAPGQRAVIAIERFDSE